jgi:hypothetical protein
MRFVVILAFLLATACATEARAPGEPRAPAAVTGMITAIERSDRGPITAFTVDADGEAYDIRIDPSRDYGFDLEHLEEHRLQELPVRVTLEERGDGLYAVEILDA